MQYNQDLIVDLRLKMNCQNQFKRTRLWHGQPQKTNGKKRK